MAARRIARTLPSCGIAALLFLLFASLHAAGSWEKKPHTEWTAQEAQKILTDSPWSKIAIVRDMRTPSGLPIPSVLTARPQPGGKCTSCGQRGGSNPSAENPTIESSPEWNSVQPSQVIYFRVVCFSSARIRQALIRLAQLNGALIPPQMLDRIQTPLPDYVIALAGPFVSVFHEASFDGLKASTYLRSRKKTGAKLDLKLFISPAERDDGMALFFFPRGTEQRPPFDTSDGHVEFATGEGSSKISASFKIEKMVVDGVPDF